MSAIVVGFDCENELDDGMAAQMVNDLCLAYPGHAWFVVIRGGVVHVKDMDLNDKWGMCLHYSQIKADAQERKRSLIRSAGEFLERARLKRGAKAEGQNVTSVEGIPDKHMARVGL
jgi:hypothetical protein